MLFRRVLLLHGYRSGPEHHWFPWLAAELAERGIEVVAARFPDAHAPDPEPGPWLAEARGVLETVDEHTAVVAHSLGCITGLRALVAIEQPWRLGLLLLVAGFDEPLRVLPQLTPFVDRPLDTAPIIAGVGRIELIGSDNDRYVWPRFTAALAARLDASVMIVPGAGHFLASEDGYIEFPLVLERLLASR